MLNCSRELWARNAGPRKSMCESHILFADNRAQRQSPQPCLGLIVVAADEASSPTDCVSAFVRIQPMQIASIG